VPDEKPPIDRALDLFVYAPVGVALYVRDMFPSMMGIFVSRGKREVKSHLGLQEPAPPAPVAATADVARRVGEGMGLARGVAEGGFGLARDITGNALQGLLALRNGGLSAPPRDPESAAFEPSASESGGAAAEDDDEHDTVVPFSYRPPASGATADSPRPAGTPSVESLSIPDYDELSASQVIERLEGLDRESLEAIRAYESGHRGRNTILGKIAQLT
jgi:hypothetical protein